MRGFSTILKWELDYTKYDAFVFVAQEKSWIKDMVVYSDMCAEGWGGGKKSEWEKLPGHGPGWEISPMLRAPLTGQFYL